MYFLLRRLDRSVGGAFLGGLMYCLSGSEISQIYGGFTIFTEAAAWAPWAFWAAHRAQREGSWGSWALCGAALGLQILAGAVQLFFYTLPALLAFSLLWRAPGEGGSQRKNSWSAWTLGWLLALTVTALLSAPQLWPTLQYLPYSARQGYSPSEFLSGSLPLHESLVWIVPGFFGWHEPSYHGAVQGTFTCEYFGLLPWALACAALASTGRARATRAWVLLAAGAFFFAQSAWTPFYGFAHALPGIKGFRYWFRDLFLLTFAVSALAAQGWDAFADPRTRRRAGAGFLLFAAVALGGAALAWFLAPARAAADAPTLGWPPGAPTAVTFQALLGMARASAVTAALSALVLAGAALLLLKKGTIPALLLLGIALHGLDQWQVIGRSLVWVEPASLEAHPPLLPAAPPPPGLEPWRIYEDHPERPNTALIQGYANAFGRHSAPLERSQSLLAALAARRETWLRLLGVRYLFLPDPSHPGAEAVWSFPTPLPEAWCPERLTSATSEEAARARVAEPGFDPARDAVLEAPPEELPPTPDAHARIHWLERSPLAATVEVEAVRDSVLLRSESWYPSWRAFVDGNPVKLTPADGAFQALRIPAGRHRVDFRFDPTLFEWSLAAAGLGLLLVLALLRLEMRPLPR
jgi:hypothetical protein